MTTFPGSPKTLKGGLVVVDPKSAAIQRVIAFQYNPSELSRSLQVQTSGGAAGAGGGGRANVVRFTAPAIETFNLAIELDAADRLEFPQDHATTVENGLLPQMAALESLVHPDSARLQEENSLANRGTLEIVPKEGPLVLFVWSRKRIAPVTVTELSITEEAFDTALNPIRAKVTLGLRVLSVHDLGFDHKGGSLFMTYLRAKEQLAQAAEASPLGALGLNSLS
jgi:hypothetical protein